jgi:PAS domain S-box-containing protein
MKWAPQSENGEDMARLRGSLAQFQILVEEAGDVALILDTGARARYVSPALRRVLGWAPERWLGRRLWEYVHAGDRATIRAALGWLKGGAERSGEIEVRCAHAAGGWRLVRVLGRNLLSDPTLRGVIVNFQDVTSWREAEAALRRMNEDLGREAKERARKALEKERLLEDLAATLPGALYEYREDTSGRGAVDYVSPGIESLIGLPASALIEDPRRLLELMPVEDQKRLDEMAARSRDELKPFEVEVRVRQPDGTERWVGLYECPRRLADGSTVWSGVALDVGPRRRAEEALRAAHAEVARASRLKDEFQAHISHELRTPLTNVLAQAQALAEGLYGALNPEQLEAVLGIKEGGDQLAGLVRDLLDVARLHAGELKLDLTPCALRTVAAAVVLVANRAAQEKRIRIEMEIEPPDLEVLADGQRLRQSVAKLMENAVKFTPAGGRVGLRVRGDAVGGTVRIVVWDTGVGIAAQDVAHVFEAFVQLEGGRARRHGGTGLGLVLARRIVELHGGRLDVSSQPGVGSEFTVVLPWHPSQVRPIPVAAVPDGRVSPVSAATGQ